MSVDDTCQQIRPFKQISARLEISVYRNLIKILKNWKEMLYKWGSRSELGHCLPGHNYGGDDGGNTGKQRHGSPAGNYIRAGALPPGYGGDDMGIASTYLREEKVV